MTWLVIPIYKAFVAIITTLILSLYFVLPAGRMPQIYRSHRLRTARVSAIGSAYHIRFSTKDRQQTLSCFYKAHSVAQAIGREHETGRTQCLCFCIMPDHVHWMLVLKKGTIGKSVHNVKRLSGYLSGETIPWQSNYFDHCIRDPKNIRTTARYIVANPLRANLVNAIGDYPHWDAAWLDSTFVDPL